MALAYHEPLERLDAEKVSPISPRFVKAKKLLLAILPPLG